MGEVYLATDLALDRPVAIKVLPTTTTSGTARERLIREARAQARVHHPNVAHIYFIGEEAGRLYFAMEYVTGKTLAERLADGPLPVHEALEIIRAAVLGLREAQRSGFTHRDVKPSNLMVDSHGVLKLLDFGLASGAPERASDGPVAQTTLAGTPLYMAPEQARGEPIDFRADVYALGATLFHLVAGQPPFKADSVDELITLHASAARPPLPRGQNPRTAIAAIDGLIARMMALSPGARFTSYDDLLQALDMASAEHTRPGGFWVRGIAAGIDMALVSLAQVLVQEPIMGGGDVKGAITVPLIVLFCTLTTARWGTTAGKALFELEVIAVATSRKPTLWQAARREIFVFGPLIAMAWLGEINKYFGAPIPYDLPGIFAAVVVFAILANLAYSSLRVPGKRTFWDRHAKTMVRYRTSRRPGPSS